MFDNDVSIGFSSNFYSDILSNLYIITGHYNTFSSAFAHFSDQLDANRSVCTCYSMPSVKVLPLLETCLDLTSLPSPSMEIQIMGGKITENLGLIRNQIKHDENLGFYLYLICKTRYSKMVKNKDMQFFMENLKMKRKKGQKNFDLPAQGFERQIFSNFPAHDLI